MQRGQKNRMRADITMKNIPLVQINKSVAHTQRNLTDALQSRLLIELDLMQDIIERPDLHTLEH